MIAGIVHKYLDYRYREIDAFISHPHKIQSEILSTLLNRASNTYIGEKYNFSSIKSTDDYRKHVPIFRYEDLRSYLDKIIVERKQNILWDKPVKWFAMSSGTTEDKSKYIPVTQESLTSGHYRCGEQMLSIYTRTNPNARFFLGKTLVLGGSKQFNSIGDGIFTGDISAVLIKNLTFLVKRSRTPESIALLADWEEKLEALTNYAVSNDIRALMGVPSWLLILLKKIKAETGKELTDLWPKMEVFFHGGVSFTPYEEQYRKILPTNNMYYWETYNASEGFFGVQFSDKSKDMLLMLDSNIYYEFIPANEWDAENPKTLTLEEVEIGKNYALVISSNGGLWRYMIGDTIEFTSIHPYLFRITGRTKSFINAFGEELIVENAEKALAVACEKTNSVISEYTVAPIYFGDDNTGAHEWLIEFETEPTDKKLFSKILDNTLKSVNSDYEAKRSYNLSLKEPVVKFLPAGSFYKWQEYANKIGGQNKIPRLSNNREFIEKVISFLEKS